MTFLFQGCDCLEETDDKRCECEPSKACDWSNSPESETKAAVWQCIRHTDCKFLHIWVLMWSMTEHVTCTWLLKSVSIFNSSRLGALQTAQFLPFLNDSILLVYSYTSWLTLYIYKPFSRFSVRLHSISASGTGLDVQIRCLNLNVTEQRVLSMQHELRQAHSSLCESGAGKAFRSSTENWTSTPITSKLSWMQALHKRVVKDSKNFCDLEPRAWAEIKLNPLPAGKGMLGNSKIGSASCPIRC